MQGRGFYVGIALWPGGTVEDWKPAYDSDKQEFGLSPCNTTSGCNNTVQSDETFLVSLYSTRCSQSHGALQPVPLTCPSFLACGETLLVYVLRCCTPQAEHGVVVAPFEVTVDTLMALRINASDIATLFSDITNSSRVPSVISAIAFRYTHNKMPAFLEVYSLTAKALEPGC